MYLIAGLGNPEPEYFRTRHNMGFDVVNQIAEENDIKINRTKFEALYGTGNIQGEKVIVVKPQTYMNLSGKSIVKFIDFYKIPLENIIVIFDDMDIEKGIIKIRKKGGPGTHNGMKSVVNSLGSEDFARVRVGIGRPKQEEDIINYVIDKITDDEYELIKKGIEKATKAVEEILKSDIDMAMNKYN